MADLEWRSFLEAYSRELLRDLQVATSVPAAVARSGWMGFEGAPEAEVAALEGRLQVQLPPSYREFLLASNGWRQSGFFIDRLYPVQDVAWFKDRNRDWIRAYTIHSLSVPDEKYFVYGRNQDPSWFRSEYLKTTLQISAEGDSAVYLLNPQVQTPGGEWEAWFFANWLPGASRYRSFREMMEAERESLKG